MIATKELTPENREKIALGGLAAANEWRRKGNPRWELNVLSHAVSDFLGVSVERFTNAHAGTNYLEDNGIKLRLERMAEINRQLFAVLLRDGKPTAGAVDNDVTPVHIAWLLGLWETGRDLLAPCLDESVRRFFPLTAIWSEYHKAIDHLAAGRPYAPVIPRVRGYEQYWVPYLTLIADLTNGRTIVASRAEIAELFKKRNGDKRLTDWKMIDGDGRHPVFWDFREASILRFADHRGLTGIVR